MKKISENIIRTEEKIVLALFLATKLLIEIKEKIMCVNVRTFSEFFTQPNY